MSKMKKLFIIQSMTTLLIALAYIFPLAPHGDNFLMPIAFGLNGIASIFYIIFALLNKEEEYKKIKDASIYLSTFFIIFALLIVTNSEIAIWIMEI